MIRHSEINDEDLRQEINTLRLQFNGNSKLKIYATMNCKSSRRIKRENRVFFLRKPKRWNKNTAHAAIA